MVERRKEGTDGSIEMIAANLLSWLDHGHLHCPAKD